MCCVGPRFCEHPVGANERSNEGGFFFFADTRIFSRSPCSSIFKRARALVAVVLSSICFPQFRQPRRTVLFSLASEVLPLVRRPLDASSGGTSVHAVPLLTVATATLNLAGNCIDAVPAQCRPLASSPPSRLGRRGGPFVQRIATPARSPGRGAGARP